MRVLGAALAALLLAGAARPQALGMGEGELEAEAVAAVFGAPTDELDHVVNLGRDGVLRDTGDFGTGPEHLGSRLWNLLREGVAAGRVRGVLVHAHGGLVSEAWALKRVRTYRKLLAGTGIFPLVLVWNTDAETIAGQLPGPVDTDPEALRLPVVLDLLGSALATGARGLVGLADPDEARLREAQGRGYSPPVSKDRSIERVAAGREHGAAWARLKANALGASRAGGGALMLARLLADLRRERPELAIHLVGHSAGAVLLAGFTAALRGLGQAIESVQLRAPAATVALYRETFGEALRAGAIRRMAVFDLTTEAELADDVFGEYGKSMLYLVRNGFEGSQPLLGLQEDWARTVGSEGRGPGPSPELVLCPNQWPDGDPRACRATSHDAIGFKDPVVLRASVNYMIGTGAAPPP